MAVRPFPATRANARVAAVDVTASGAVLARANAAVRVALIDISLAVCPFPARNMVRRAVVLQPGISLAVCPFPARNKLVVLRASARVAVHAIGARAIVLARPRSALVDVGFTVRSREAILTCTRVAVHAIGARAIVLARLRSAIVDVGFTVRSRVALARDALAPVATARTVYVLACGAVLAGSR